MLDTIGSLGLHAPNVSNNLDSRIQFFGHSNVEDEKEAVLGRTLENEAEP